MSSVTVLTPTGRRQKVNVTPNTSILQILEDVCTKQGLSSSDFDLRHHKTVLDPSSTVRFSNLPNNAQLEIIKTAKVKLESTVTIGLQLPSNERVMHTFDTQTSLWDVLIRVQEDRNEVLTQSQDDEGNVLVPVCVYMRREVVGEEQLQKTTLRSLGLTGGKAMIRLFFRIANKIVEQAYVEAIVFAQPKPVLTYEQENWDEETETAPIEFAQPNPVLTYERENWDEEAETAPTSVQTVNRQDYYDVGASTSSAQTFGSHYVSDSDNHNDHTQPESISTEMASVPKKVAAAKRPLDTGEDGASDATSSIASYSAALFEEPMDESPQLQIDRSREKLVYLDDKGSLLYCLDEVDAPVKVELPDSYFDVTVSDVKLLFSDLKKKREELEDGILRTQSMRESECLLRLNRYPKAVIRVVFPDRLVLQGQFRAICAAEEIFQFVRSFLIDEKCDFNLFTTPPKKLLNPKDRLFEIPLVPAAIVYFGCDSRQNQYLKDDVLQKISSPRAVDKDTSLTRVSSKLTTANIGFDGPSQSNTVSRASSSSSTASDPRQDSSKTVPKWFAGGKK